LSELTAPRGVNVYEQRGKVAQKQEEIAHDKIAHDLIRGYFEKIKKHDCLLVVNAEKKGIKGYIGANTLIEMAFAFVLHKPIYSRTFPTLPTDPKLRRCNPLSSRVT